jgi:hypothetical protein
MTTFFARLLGASMTDTLPHSATSTEVSAARKALLTAARSEPDRWWSADELRAAAQNGYRSTVVTVALNDLVDNRKLRLNSRLLIQFAQ